MEDTSLVGTVRTPPSDITTDEELIAFMFTTMTFDDYIQSLAFLFISGSDRPEGRGIPLVGAIHTNSPTLSGDAPPPANLQGGMASSRLKGD
jgi:predicted phosphoadenosine phosphosulfate sulfurtransferase